MAISVYSAETSNLNFRDNNCVGKLNVYIMIKRMQTSFLKKVIGLFFQKINK